MDSIYTIEFLLIKKTWDGRFVGKVEEWEILRNGRILVMGDDFETGGRGGGMIPLYRLYLVVLVTWLSI